MESRYDSAGAIRTIARGSGTILAIFFFLAFAPKFISEFSSTSTPLPSGREWEGQVMVAMFLAYMTGYAVGWWWSLWGGIIICLAALVVSAPFIIIQGHYNSLIFGIPVLIVGGLYIVLHILESRENT